METQITIRLSGELFRELEAAAKRLRRSRSAVARLALDAFLSGDAEVASRSEAPIERIRDLIGSVASGTPDLGSAHREHLLSVIREGRKRWEES